jgi:hypothetical protein
MKPWRSIVALATSSDWYTSDDSVIAPMVKEAAAKYADEKTITTGCITTH